MARVRERQAHLKSPAGAQELQDRVDRISKAVPPGASRRLIAQAQQADRATQRLVWLRREADMVGNAAAPHVPCRSGCNHCCHIPVSVTETEARIIARETGRRLAQPEPGAVVEIDAHDDPAANLARAHEATEGAPYSGTPCTFLDQEGGGCAIYQHRPMACRHQISVDSDALLCQLAPKDTGGTGPAEPITVPYLDRRIFKGLSILLMSSGTRIRMADIRDWFPGHATTPGD